MTTKIMRWREWAYPPRPVHREVREVAADVFAAPDRQPAGSSGAGASVAGGSRPPVLFVPGFGHGAWVFAEHWLEHTAGRGFPAYAMSLRGHGTSGTAPRSTLRAYVHDVVQVAAGLPRQAVLVGHGAGALVVAGALARYPARAGVLVAPVLGGPRLAAAVAARHPLAALPALFGGRLRPGRSALLSREVPTNLARGYVSRLGRAGALAQWQLVLAGAPPTPVGRPPMLVVGSPDDRLVPRWALARTARWYGGAPLLFPGMGHDLMVDARWAEPIDAILDWLDSSGR